MILSVYHICFAFSVLNCDIFITDQMFSSGLSQTLIDSLTEVVLELPELLSMVQVCVWIVCGLCRVYHAYDLYVLYGVYHIYGCFMYRGQRIVHGVILRQNITTMFYSTKNVTRKSTIYL